MKDTQSMLDIWKWFESIDSPLFMIIEINIAIGSLGIVLLPRIIYAALCLTFVFINIALLYLLLNAEFLAAAQVLIYVGAINVLIVFAIMLVNLPSDTIDKTSNFVNKIAAVSTVIVFIFLFVTIAEIPVNNFEIHTSNRSVQMIGTTLFQDLLLPFELLSLLLLVALVGAIHIARKEIQLK
jgi:NAD(P)H-quinone oxidoreductase subunit 6